MIFLLFIFIVESITDVPHWDSITIIPLTNFKYYLSLLNKAGFKTYNEILLIKNGTF